MDFLIELILGIVFDATVMDAALDGMESKKVPMPLRILLVVFLLALFVVIAAFLVWASWESGSVLVWILLMTILAVLLGGFCWKVRKAFQKRK